MLTCLRQNIQDLLRRRVLEEVQTVLEEELSEALGTSRYERSDERRGDGKGHETRRITMGLGTENFRVPRGGIALDDERTRKFRSEIVPRYQRRTREVNEAILGAYLAGANTRHIRRAVEPLLGSEHLSKSAMSRRRAAQSTVRPVEAAGSVAGAVRDPVPRRLSPHGAHGAPCGRRGGAGRYGGRHEAPSVI